MAGDYGRLVHEIVQNDGICHDPQKGSWTTLIATNEAAQEIIFSALSPAMVKRGVGVYLYSRPVEEQDELSGIPFSEKGFVYMVKLLCDNDPGALKEVFVILANKDPGFKAPEAAPTPKIG
jgi:hypothetical protein